MVSEKQSHSLDHRTAMSRSRSRADTSKRVSRACLHCRQRKSKCDLYVLNCPFAALFSFCFFVLFLTLYKERAVAAPACPPANAVCARVAYVSWAARIEAVDGFAKIK